MSNRDPFPSPKFENGFTLSGFRPQQKKTFDTPTHIAQTEQPWNRLHDAATFASCQRSVMYDKQQLPSDSLDFHLKSTYDHHKDVFQSKNQILYQKETLYKDCMALQNSEMQTIHENKLTKDIRVYVDPQRRSIYNIK
ncbi:protein C1orf194 homolog [Thalassophryne amazonica]|uniref:protein C1orf194 homolog n=1 Tax=Thalassophryne amazonica TaxID=390379 RepID=UPI0014719980|nr:protein C1orf194 homolog [Thalassophryne amazonica]